MAFQNGNQRTGEQPNSIDIMALADRGAIDWSNVPDQDFPTEIVQRRDAAQVIARLRAELAKEVPENMARIGRNPPKLTAAQKEARERRQAFWRSRILLKVTRVEKVSNLPSNMNPDEVRPNGKRIEFPDGVWCGAAPTAIDGLQDGHMQVHAEVKNRANDDLKLPRGSDLAFEGMQVVYYEKKTYTVQIFIPASAYPSRKSAAA